MASHFEIGTSLGSMVDVLSLSSDAEIPIGNFFRWADTADLGNGLARGLGAPSATWWWCFIPPDMRVALMTYCPDRSARVYIRTEDDPNIGTTGVFQAAMIWPSNDTQWNQTEFVITFRDLIREAVT